MDGALAKVDGNNEDNSEEYTTLIALGILLAKSRRDAVLGRKQSGIEEEWLRDEEYYEGIDDVNRGEYPAHMNSNWTSKPPGQDAIRKKTTGSTAFTNITRPYVDSAAARVGDMLLPTDEPGWVMNSTPLPELTPFAEGNFTPEVEEQIIEAQTNPETGKVDEAGVERTRNDIIDKTTKDMEIAKSMVEKATKRIKDWHVECQYHLHARRAIDTCVKSGTGVLKGPIMQTKQKAVYDKKLGELAIVVEDKPVTMYIDHWNLYPDPGCGEDLHQGAYTWEKDYITRADLEALSLAEGAGYLSDQIDIVLAQGPHEVKMEEEATTPELPGLARRDTDNLFEIWYFYGRLEKEELELGGELPEDISEEITTMHSQVTMINNIPIRAVQNPMDTGDFPYDLMVWQKRRGSCWGVGLSYQIRTPQNIVKNAVRSMMDNAGRAGGPQVIIQDEVVEPEDNVYEITPWKIWRAAEGAEQKGLDNAFRFVKIDMMQVELQNIVEMGMRLAEQVTGMAMSNVSKEGKAQVKTASEAIMQNQTDSTVMRRLARNFDDNVTSPHIRRYYDYILQYGEDDEKGDLNIEAKGSTALVERAAHAEEVVNLGQYVTNPIFGIDPKKWMKEHLRGSRLVPEHYEYDDDEWEEIVKQMSQPPPDPKLEVAQINAQSRIDAAKIGAGSKAADIESKENMKAFELAGAKELAAANNETKLLISSMTADLTSITEGGKATAKDKETLDKIKASFAELVLQLQTQKELSMEGAGGEVITPLVEPPGRADDGKSYQE